MSLGRATQCSENKVSPRLRSRLDRDIQQPAIGSTSGPKALSRPLPGSAGQGEGPWAVGGAPALPSWNAAPSSLSRTGQRVRVASWVLAPGRRLGSSVPLRLRAGAGCRMGWLTGTSTPRTRGAGLVEPGPRPPVCGPLLPTRFPERLAVPQSPAAPPGRAGEERACGEAAWGQMGGCGETRQGSRPRAVPRPPAARCA